jgi:SAM-dependent methyltransferase
MHKRIAGAAQKQAEDILEIGAGTLNHLRWEKHYQQYDIVEPARFLVESASQKFLIRRIYDSLQEIESTPQFDRIVSIAVLEHMTDLPSEVARAALLLKNEGLFCAGVPSMGSLLWDLVWKYGTGTAFHRRTGLDYAIIMRHEHVNDLKETEQVISWFFEDVKTYRFPLRFLQLSLYTVFLAKGVRQERCAAQIAYTETKGERSFSQ